MESAISSQEAKELLDAQANIWKHNYSFLSSIALSQAINMGIPDSIHMHGMPMTLNELATSLSIHKNKVPFLNRLMRLLVSLDFFTIIPLHSEEKEEEEEGFGLTLSSQLLLKNHPLTQAPFVEGTSLQQEGRPFAPHLLSDWLRNDVDESPFFNANGMNFWEHMDSDQKCNNSFNQAMESDSRIVTHLLVNSKEFKGFFEGFYSLVDVGGGNGTTTKAISKACPWLKCIVLDLPRVIQGLKEDVGNVKYVSGDMFEEIPNTEVVLLKWILHNWGDDDCVKILKRCKEAISKRHGGGGKVIIIDMVVETENEKSKRFTTQLLFDMQMMLLFGHGKERTKQQWQKLFIEAGFKNFKIHPILGLRSVIELYLF